MIGWRIPAPLDVPWAKKLRPLGSAEISTKKLGDGRLEQRVVHAPLVGVTRPMLGWWMNQVDRQIDWRGKRVLAYRLWHPCDHIHFEIRRRPNGTISRFHIVEAFQADPKYLQDWVFEVPKLEPEGFRIELRRFGVPVMTMDEDWEEIQGGIRWTVTQRIGAIHPIMGPVSRWMIERRRDMLDAWLRHNVEEAGAIAEFLPELYECESRW